MRVALVGWESDAVPLSALNDLGLDVVSYTRWLEGEPLREVRGGVRIERCPHGIGGGMEAEAASLGQSILSRDLEYGFGADSVEVIHALDATAWRAADTLAARHPRAARVGTVSVSDVHGERVVVPLMPGAGVLVASHPVAEEGLRVAVPSDGPRIATVLSSAELAESGASRGGLLPSGKRVVTVWLPRALDCDPVGLASVLGPLSREIPELGVCVLGQGPQAERLSRLLAAKGRLVRPSARESQSATAVWNAVVSQSSVLGLVGSDLASDPAAWASWSLGVPVARLDGDPGLVSAEIRDAVAGGERTGRVLSAGRSLAGAILEPSGVARRLLSVYLDAVAGAGRGASSEVPPVVSPPLPNRLDLIAVSAREAYASWHVRPADRERALAWLGEDASRAALVLRVQDVSGRQFHGHDPHRSWDIEVSPGERGRGLQFETSGLSLAVSLGFRGGSGAFLPLAYAPLLHLPPDEPSVYPADRRLRVLGRSSVQATLPSH